MAIPFSSGYEPINLLNSAIQNQAARQQQGYLQASALNDASVADSLNRIVQQKALEQQSRDRQAHYGLQQQQLANDLAYRNAVLREAELRSIEQAKQFDAQFGLNKKIAEAQIKQTENPFYGQRDALAFGMQGAQDINKFNVEATPVAGNANLAIQNLKGKRDAAIADIAAIRGEKNPLTVDFWHDVITSDEAWAKKIRAIDAAYRDEIGKIGQATQGKAIIRNKIDARTGQALPDDFEAIPVTLPPMVFPNMAQPQPQATPQALSPLLTQPPVNVAPQPFVGWGLQGTNTTGGSNQNAVPKVVVSPGAPNRVFRFDPQRGLVPLQ
jgi:hypothetical protein